MRQTKWIRGAAHVGGWALLFSLLLGFVSISRRDGSGSSPIPLSILFYFGACVAIFYFHTNVLLPRLYLRQRYIAYFGVFVLLLLVVYTTRPFDAWVMNRMPPFEGMRPHPPRMDRSFSPPHGRRMQREPHADIISIILLTMIWAIGFGQAILREWRSTERRATQAEADKANAELSFLKAQINPHFLFNTLNNIYAMAVSNNENTAPSIMKLSQIMRYLTDQAAQDQVPLQEAVRCMTDFIDLHRLRFGPTVTINYTVSGSLEGKSIIPLIFLTFIENMFKYGVSAHEHAPIRIELEAGEKNIRFFCENKIMRQPKEGENTGIGIDNIKKRLAHAYPGKHNLQISSEEGYFRVLLLLDL